jgi:hypothetical protein
MAALKNHCRFLPGSGEIEPHESTWTDRHFILKPNKGGLMIEGKTIRMHILGMCPKAMSRNQRRSVLTFCKWLKSPRNREFSGYKPEGLSIMDSFSWEETCCHHSGDFWAKLFMKKIIEDNSAVNPVGG